MLYGIFSSLIGKDEQKKQQNWQKEKSAMKIKYIQILTKKIFCWQK